MRKRLTRLAALFVILPALALAGCESSQFGEKTGLGAALGAAGGGLIGAAANGGTTGILAGVLLGGLAGGAVGNTLEGILAGVLLGGLAGGAVGNTLEQEDRRLAQQQAQLALEQSRTGQTAAWRNPDSGNSGSLTPTRTFQTSDGTFCREYQQTITVGGREESGFGTACRQPDGNWRVQS